MSSIGVGPTMSQKIFSKGLSVQAVSLYLLCCAVADTGSPITRATLLDKWNGSAEALERELRNLEEKKILCQEGSPGEDHCMYRIVDEKDWS